MTTIRPSFPQPQLAPQPASQRADAARLAAQRAFFDMAAGQAQAAAPRPKLAAAQAAVQSAAPAAPRPQRMPDAHAEPPAKVLRPGSLLDIRV